MDMYPFQWGVTDPSDVDPFMVIQQDWGMQDPVITKPVKPTFLKGVGITVSDYTTRFINPIMGEKKIAFETQQKYYVGYVILIGASLCAYWLFRKGGKLI